MKSHISATIDTELLRKLDRKAAEEQRSRSQAIERAIEKMLEQEGALTTLPVSRAVFDGNFSREDTYGDR